MSGVDVTLSVDLSGLKRRLNDAEVAILNAHADTMVGKAKAHWEGWLYEDVGPNYQSGTSKAAWKRGTTQSTEGVRTVEIVNDAAHKGKTYAGYVHRKGKTRLEADVVIKDVFEPKTPTLVKALTDAIAASDLPPKPQKLRRGTPGPRKSSSVTL